MEHWDEGVHMIRGKGASGAVPLILSCGVHGDELTPVPVVESLLADLQARRLLPLHPCLLIFANPPALAERRRYLKHNLNRLFGAPMLPAGVEGQRARALEQHCREFTELYGPGWHLDLHSTIKPSRHARFALQPQRNHPYDSRWPAVLAQAGFSALVHQHSPAHTFAHFTCNQLGHDSFTLECGDIGGEAAPGANTPEPAQQTAALLDHFLRQLLTSKDLPETSPDGSTLQQYDVVVDLIRRSAGFRFHVDEQGENFATFAQGTLIADDAGQPVTAPVDGCALLFANSQVPVGDRAGLLLAPSLRTG